MAFEVPAQRLGTSRSDTVQAGSTEELVAAILARTPGIRPLKPTKAAVPAKCAEPDCERPCCPGAGPNEPGEYPTLGYEVGDWIESHVVIPDGYNRGKPYLLTDEMWRFLLKRYRVFEHAAPYPAPDGLAYYGSQLRRSQKWGKDPFGAAMILANALGPSRFDGWNASGEPVGRRTRRR
jgi:hypothetical protein